MDIVGDMLDREGRSMSQPSGVQAEVEEAGIARGPWGP